MNIHEIREKIKQPSFYEPVAFIFIFILISLTSFGLGRLSIQGGETGDGGVTIVLADGSLVPKENLLSNTAPSKSAQIIKSVHSAGSVFASKNGSTYYFESCGSSSRIKEENKVWFNSETAAQNAGYRLAKVCE